MSRGARIFRSALRSLRRPMNGSRDRDGGFVPEAVIERLNDGSGNVVARHVRCLWESDRSRSER